MLLTLSGCTADAERGGTQDGAGCVLSSGNCVYLQNKAAASVAARLAAGGSEVYAGRFAGADGRQVLVCPAAPEALSASLAGAGHDGALFTLAGGQRVYALGAVSSGDPDVRGLEMSARLAALTDFTEEAVLTDLQRGRVYDSEGGLADHQSAVMKLTKSASERLRTDPYAAFGLIGKAAARGMTLHAETAAAVREALADAALDHARIGMLTAELLGSGHSLGLYTVLSDADLVSALIPALKPPFDYRTHEAFYQAALEYCDGAAHDPALSLMVLLWPRFAEEAAALAEDAKRAERDYAGALAANRVLLDLTEVQVFADELLLRTASGLGLQGQLESTAAKDSRVRENPGFAAALELLRARAAAVPSLAAAVSYWQTQSAPRQGD